MKKNKTTPSDKEDINSRLFQIAKDYTARFLTKDSSCKGVFLVGSVAREEADEGSDVDLMIITSRKLSPDQQDNMREDVYKRCNISLIFTNLRKIKKNIKDGIAADICFAKEAVSLYDPENLIIRIKELVSNFSFEINLKSRINNAIAGLKDAERALKRGSEEEANITALTTSFFFMRGYIQFKNSPYTSAKQMFKELKKINNSLFDSFKKMWLLKSSDLIIEELKFQIDKVKQLENEGDKEEKNLDILNTNRIS